MRKYAVWLLPFVWMGIIFYSSAQPYEKQDIKPLLANTFDFSFLTPVLDWVSFTYHQSEISVTALGVNGFIEFVMRKGAHITVFFILMILFYVALKRSMTHRITNIFISLLLTIAYAGIDEFHQGFTDNRTPYIGDVFLDSFGALVAGVFLLAIHWKKKFLGEGHKK